MIAIFMKRNQSIEALIRNSSKAYENLKRAYEVSLHDKNIGDDLKVDIKNIFENLRSCLDYLANELFEAFCKGSKKPDRLYFPILQNAPEFAQKMQRDYPGLKINSRSIYDILEDIQPYRDAWLGQFNKLNNENKHQDLVEQTRNESRHVSVKRPGGGGVSWGPGVTFGSGVGVLGVPIDPSTQLPVPNNIVKTEITFWVDFKFREGGQSVLPFIKTSIDSVENLYKEIAKHC